MADPSNASLTTGLLTASAGLLGVAVTLIFNFVRERSRARQEADERQKMRIHELRRDVYFGAAESAVRVMAALGRLTNPKVEFDDIAKVAEEFHSSVARVNLVAAGGLLRRTLEFQRMIASTQVDLMIERAPMIALQNQVEATDRRASAHDQDAKRFIEMLRMMNVTPGSDPKQFDAIAHQAELANQNMMKEATDLQELHKAQQANQRAFIERMLPRIELLTRKQIDVLVAIRADIGVDHAVDVLRQELEINLDAVRTIFRKILEQSPKNETSCAPTT